MEVARNGRVKFDCHIIDTQLMEISGFTAIVNKKLSAKYDKLVNSATELIKVLPWGPLFEVDVFRKPDFTALEVLSFAVSFLS